MTGEEYLSKLNNLWENINKDNIDEKKQEINTLSKIIPKRLKYFAVQARLHQLEMTGACMRRYRFLWKNIGDCTTIMD